MRELILYATPTGRLADQCARYFQLVEANGMATTAQTYPPHCTLTGFFHRIGDRAHRAVDQFNQGLAAAGPVPAGAVEVIGLRAKPDWVGLELRSRWLRQLTDTLAVNHTTAPDEDALRVKDWLHLSLAYGVRPLDDHGTLALESIDPAAEADWEVGLWERLRGNRWVRLSPS